jgi:acetyl/propionyl-CoA carboxylase alpha subunit
LNSDSSSLHVRQADQAVPLGPIDGPAGNPHQNIDLLIQVAKDYKADAIHPGYGYLSENAEFSKRVTDAHILFLGPSSDSMAVLGDKRSAKQYLLKHAPSIPLIPGYNGSEQSLDRLLVEADRIGFPILIKASAGGGGKGMRIVRERSSFADDLSRAQSEAQRSFGSADCILEKYIQRSKHVEIQMLGDRHGNVVSLMDRECSIQRRHQKVIEEAPSPWLSNKLRKELSETGIAIGKLLRYESAGTVEFIVDVDVAKFYFLEVNTRIQVEHPITEEISGVDIVALQIYVASGGRLDNLGYFRDGMAPQVGHAIECRLCAEDPNRDFVPDMGVVRRWTPASEILPISQAKDVRFETGIETGSHISVYFDSLIAKIVVWAPTRVLAIAKMVKMLSYTVCIGIRSNQSFLQSCLMHPSFRDPGYTTNFIPDLMLDLVKNPHVQNIVKVQQLLSFFPSLVRRTAQTVSPSRRAFRSLPLGFRNQKADTANAQIDIVRIHSQPSTIQIISWPFQAHPYPNPQVSQTVNIIPAFTSSKTTESNSPSLTDKVGPKNSVQLARDFNAISSQIRGIQASSGTTAHRVTQQCHKSVEFGRAPTALWSLQDLIVSIDDERYDIYTAVAPVSADAASYQTVFAHVAALGIYIEYHVFSLLAYGESLRVQSEGVPEAAAGRNPKAPMPCKILSVLKKEGEEILAGEVGMVVESMKMEMNVLATVKGTFKARFSKGDAVEEGSVLFTVI